MRYADVYKPQRYISIGDLGFPRAVGLWVIRWLVVSFCGEGARGDRWEADGGEPWNHRTWKAMNHHLLRNGLG